MMNENSVNVHDYIISDINRYVVSSVACEDKHARCRILGDPPADVRESALFKFSNKTTHPHHTSLDFNWKLRHSNSYRNNILDRCIFNIYTTFPLFKTSAHPKGASGLHLSPLVILKKKQEFCRHDDVNDFT